MGGIVSHCMAFICSWPNVFCWLVGFTILQLILLQLILNNHITATRSHRHRGVNLDLRKIHTRKKESGLIAEVLKAASILNPQFVVIRLRHLELSKNFGLCFSHMLTKGFQLSH